MKYREIGCERFRVAQAECAKGNFMKIPKIFKMLIALSFLTSQGFSNDNLKCRALFEPQDGLLSSELIQDIQKANSTQTNYVFPLKTKINGIERLIVLVGEKHVKSEVDANALRDVRRHFEHRGNEGFDPSKYWFPNALRKTLEHKLDSNNTRLSSIYESLAETMVPQIEEGILKQTSQDVINGIISYETALEQLTPSYLQRKTLSSEDFKDNTAKALIPIFELALKMIDYPAMQAKLAARISELSNNQISKKDLVSHAKEIHEYHLEKGFTPTLREQLFGLAKIMASSLTSTKCVALQMCALGGAMFLPAEASTPATISIFSIISLTASSLVISTLEMALGKTDAHRNKVMFANINEILVENPKVNRLLVTVGSMHILGIRDLMIQNGYTDIEIGPN